MDNWKSRIGQLFGKGAEGGSVSEQEDTPQAQPDVQENPYRNVSTLGDDVGRLQNYRGSEDEKVEPLTGDEDTRPMAPIDPETGEPVK